MWFSAISRVPGAVCNSRRYPNRSNTRVSAVNPLPPKVCNARSAARRAASQEPPD
jgi:hypothetical protein